jgi:hypothetical protein
MAPVRARRPYALHSRDGRAPDPGTSPRKNRLRLGRRPDIRIRRPRQWWTCCTAVQQHNATRSGQRHSLLPLRPRLATRCGSRLSTAMAALQSSSCCHPGASNYARRSSSDRWPRERASATSGRSTAACLRSLEAGWRSAMTRSWACAASTNCSILGRPVTRARAGQAPSAASRSCASSAPSPPALTA